MQITFKAMCKMLISLEDEEELGSMQKDVGFVCEAMLAFPLNLPWTRFHKGIMVRSFNYPLLDVILYTNLEFKLNGNLVKFTRSVDL